MMRKLVTSLAHLALVLAVFALVPATVHAAATILVESQDQPGEGFNDTTPWTPTGGNTATTLGQARLNAFQHAANIWGGMLNSDVTIVVEASMDLLDCTPTQAVLGSAGASNWYRNFQNAPLSNTFYPLALANSFAGFDIVPGSGEIIARFNSRLNGDPDCLSGAGWYYGFDADPPAGDFDFVTVVMHEIGHGLGFQTIMNVETGALPFGNPDPYILNLDRAGASPSDYPSMSDGQRAAANTSDPDLRWVGGNVTYMLPGSGISSGLNGNYIRMHAPGTLAPGSSVAHFAQDVFPNEVMEHAYSGADHDPGLAVNLMNDLGWELDSSVPVLFEQVRATPTDAAVAVSWRYWADEPVIGFNVYRQQIDSPSEDLANTSGMLISSAEQFLDARVEPGGMYRYSVAAVTADGSEIRSPMVTVSVSRFTTELVQNRPNPFNPATELRYKLGRDEQVVLRVYDVTGQLVRTLVNEHQTAGSYGVFWNGRDETGREAPAGVYFGRLETDELVQTRRMLLLK